MSEGQHDVYVKRYWKMKMTTEEFELIKAGFMKYAIQRDDLKLMYEIEHLVDDLLLYHKINREYSIYIQTSDIVSNYTGIKHIVQCPECGHEFVVSCEKYSKETYKCSENNRRRFVNLHEHCAFNLIKQLRKQCQRLMKTT